MQHERVRDERARSSSILLLMALAPEQIAALGTLVTAVVGAGIALVRLGGQQQGIKITNDQGAATIYDNLVRTLQAEVTRLNELVSAKERRIAELESELARKNATS